MKRWGLEKGREGGLEKRRKNILFLTNTNNTNLHESYYRIKAYSCGFGRLMFFYNYKNDLGWSLCSKSEKNLIQNLKITPKASNLFSFVSKIIQGCPTKWCMLRITLQCNPFRQSIITNNYGKL